MKIMPFIDLAVMCGCFIFICVKPKTPKDIKIYFVLGFSFCALGLLGYLLSYFSA